MEAGISIKELVGQTLNHVAKVEEPLLIYPEGAPDAVTIIDRDVLSLQPLHFPSENTVNFGNKYLLRETPRSSMRERFYILDSSFYSKLVGTGGASDGIEYDEARTWTGEVDLFEKDYIFIPIHQGMDWSLVVIRHLSNLRLSSGDKFKGSPRIIHIDSDRGRHQNLGIESRLRRYILQAWNDRYQNTSELDQLSDMKYIYTKVPQDSEYDSAIYLFHYIELLLELGSSDVVASSQEEPDFTMWDPSDVLAKRNQIRDLILKLSGKNQLELTLRSNYQEILSWLRDEAIADRRIDGWHFKDSTSCAPTSCAQGLEITEHEDNQTVLKNVSDDDEHGDAIIKNCSSFPVIKNAMIGNDLKGLEYPSKKRILRMPLDDLGNTKKLPELKDLIGLEQILQPDKLVELPHLEELREELRHNHLALRTHLEELGHTHLALRRERSLELEDLIELEQIRQLHGKERSSCSREGGIPRKEIEGKRKRSRSKTWSEDESLVLLRRIADENRFWKGKVIDWHLVSQETGRSRKECQGRFDTLSKAFKSVKKICIDTGKAFSELTDDDLGKLHMATAITEELYLSLDMYWSRKELRKRPKLIKDGENGNGSNESHRNNDNYSLSSSLYDPPPQVSTESFHGEFSRLLGDCLSGDAQEISEGPLVGILLPNCSDDPVSYLPSLLTERDTSQPKTVSTSSTAKGVYLRRLFRNGKDTPPVKYEPRFKPPRDKGLPPSSLYLGQYDTEEEAKSVYQIAAFYYGKSNDQLYLGDGVHFTIPPMGEGELHLSGREKSSWVSRKARSVYQAAVNWKRELENNREFMGTPHNGESSLGPRDIDQIFDSSGRLSNLEGGVDYSIFSVP